MRLHSLVVEGFGPFRARQRVDFDGFADDGIFLIAGRTGAGKSSILDAVCFALYGGVPRYDSGEKRLRSDHSEPDEPTSVSVEFSTVAGRFRVTRSPAYERPAKRGGGMTTQAPSALLERFTDEGWVGMGARVVDVAGELAEHPAAVAGTVLAGHPARAESLCRLPPCRQQGTAEATSTFVRHRALRRYPAAVR